ncbi:MAG: beta-galactosidase trimerization domain-containing protein [Oscillospiraceae bacterium]
MQLAARQVHLDFHTSENIPGIAKDFDSASFAKMAKDAHVNSMTVFARCHHGWLYYDSPKFPELIHPHLENGNLLLEQVRALHAEGIRAPIYITVQWDYHMATTRPEWLIRKPGGAHEGSPFTEPGFYQSLCVNTGYNDYLTEMTEEILGILGDELDGVFFDIVGIRPCWCASCREEMKERGIEADNEEAVQAFAAFSMNRFKEKMTKLVRGYSDDCTIFYNAGHVGPCTKESRDSYTHFELESLPSGSWGYQHFPVTARYARTLGLDCMGMTGKFHTAWGDFHSLKNQAALEFESFRMFSYGFACSIGDQLPPQGMLNPATYKLIGNVYGQMEAVEDWARPSRPVVEAALLTGENPLYEHIMPEDVMGAAQLLEELGLQFDIIDRDMALEPYKLILLPDTFLADSAFQKKLDAYVAGGGAVIACGRGGMNDDGDYPACFSVEYNGVNENYPDFIVADGPLGANLEPDNEYVVYKQGNMVSPKGSEVLLEAKAPFFPRKGDKFCSHMYTPSAEGDGHPVAFRNGNVILFSHPLFGQYRENAPHWCKTLVNNAVNLLLPDRLIRHDGPSTLSVQVMEQPEKSRYVLHLLSYIPVRKSATIDIVEERAAAYDVTVKLDLPMDVKSARIAPEGTELKRASDGGFFIPKVDGYCVIELNY